MVHASLFSGIGGFDLAAEWAGWTNAFNCEIDPFCQKILKYHFPDAKQYRDIKTTDFAVWRGRIDVLTGGFPCQPFSLAGKRKGTEDERHLWPEMLRAIQQIRPRWIVGENVFGIVNWSEGMVFEQVCSDMETEGYEIQPFILPACAVGAPHRRDRCWFVAHCADAGVETMREGQNGIHAVGAIADTKCVGRREVYDNVQSQQPDGTWVDGNGGKWDASDADHNRCRIGTLQPELVSGSCGSTYDCNGGANGIVADTEYDRLEHSIVANSKGALRGEKTQCLRAESASPESCRCVWDGFPTQPPVYRRDDGLPFDVDGITFPKWRNQSIKAYGNAIVPQVALQIFETIKEVDRIFRPSGE